MVVFRLALQSLRNRYLTALLTILAIALSVMLFLGVEKVRTGARASFANTISGTDLIVGSRAGSVQLLLYSVFRIGNATANITWQSYKDIKARKEVAWTVPMALGDSHRGFRVLGTTDDIFKYYKYRRDQSITFNEGKKFEDLFDAVVGADVAAQLKYNVDDKIIIAHGLGRVSFSKHKTKPFRISGILKKTGTPVDRTVFISLKAYEAIHVGWETGHQKRISQDQLRQMDLQPKAITSALIGLKSKLGIFRLQRYINEYREEPLTAILPGVALQELWSLVSIAENALSIVSSMVILTALLGMLTMILSTLNERRREMAILRSVGAKPRVIGALLVSEAGLLTFCGVLLGVIGLYIVLFIIQPYIDTEYGLHISIEFLTLRESLILLGICIAGFVAGLLPALRAYYMSVADGMIVRQ